VRDVRPAHGSIDARAEGHDRYSAQGGNIRGGKCRNTAMPKEKQRKHEEGVACGRHHSQDVERSKALLTLEECESVLHAEHARQDCETEDDCNTFIMVVRMQKKGESDSLNSDPDNRLQYGWHCKGSRNLGGEGSLSCNEIGCRNGEPKRPDLRKNLRDKDDEREEAAFGWPETSGDEYTARHERQLARSACDKRAEERAIERSREARRLARGHVNRSRSRVGLHNQS
jgi:hypothetical protein